MIKRRSFTRGLFGKEDEKCCDMVIINSCNALIKMKKYNEAARRLENADSFAEERKSLKRLLTSAYKSIGEFGKLVKLKWQKYGKIEKKREALLTHKFNYDIISKCV